MSHRRTGISSREKVKLRKSKDYKENSPSQYELNFNRTHNPVEIKKFLNKTLDFTKKIKEQNDLSPDYKSNNDHL
jgi:hypothetical protein